MTDSGHLAVERRLLSLIHHPNQSRSSRRRLYEIHAFVLRRHLHFSTLLLSHFLSSCLTLHLHHFALSILSLHPNPSLALFNSTLKSLSLHPPLSFLSLPFFSLLRRRSLLPDSLSFPPLLKSSTHLPHHLLGSSIHSTIILSGFDTYPSIAIGIVELYAHFGRLPDAWRVFDSMCHKDVVVWNMMINGYSRKGDLGDAHLLFREMPQRNVVSWNSMINGFARAGRDAEALELFREMWEAGFEPDDATLATVFPVCARSGELDLGRWIHDLADRIGLVGSAVNVANSIVDMYSKCGDLESARMVFDGIRRKSVVSWNAMINGLAWNGCGDAGVQLFEEMKSSGVQPNAGTFVGVLGCCTHAGLVERGRELFRLMATEHGIEPRLEHYGCMVDLLGRSGLVKEAYELIRRMPMRPNAAIWGALLGASRNSDDLTIAELAAKELVVLEPWNSGNYVLLSNLYAEKGRWDDVENVRLLMKERSVMKSPGHSAVEADSRRRLQG